MQANHCVFNYLINVLKLKMGGVREREKVKEGVIY